MTGDMFNDPSIKKKLAVAFADYTGETFQSAMARFDNFSTAIIPYGFPLWDDLTDNEKLIVAYFSMIVDDDKYSAARDW